MPRFSPFFYILKMWVKCKKITSIGDFGDFWVCKKMSDSFYWREFLGLFWLHFYCFFIINYLLKMIIPLVFADYSVKKWVIYYEVGKKNTSLVEKWVIYYKVGDIFLRISVIIIFSTDIRQLKQCCWNNISMFHWLF